jgi:cytochrome c-type biogenesis protein
LRSLSPLQLIVLGIVALVAIFLVVGTITQSTSQEQVFNPMADQPFTVLATLAFIGGMLSFASPCTLPILPAYFAFAFQSGRKHIALNTIVFMLGLATVFSIMGAGASAIGRILRENQSLIMLLAGSLVIVFGVMSLMGKGFSGVQQQQEERTRNTGLGGSYFFGMTFAVGWTSCIGPILGIVLAMAGTTASVSRGMMLLFIYALGLGLPLIIVSTFFGRASRQSMLWRALRGKGWTVSTHAMIIGLLFRQPGIHGCPSVRVIGVGDPGRRTMGLHGSRKTACCPPSFAYHSAFQRVTVYRHGIPNGQRNSCHVQHLGPRGPGYLVCGPGRQVSSCIQLTETYE